jgi:hypothetical protein
MDTPISRPYFGASPPWAPSVVKPTVTLSYDGTETIPAGEGKRIWMCKSDQVNGPTRESHLIFGALLSFASERTFAPTMLLISKIYLDRQSGAGTTTVGWS